VPLHALFYTKKKRKEKKSEFGTIDGLKEQGKNLDTYKGNTNALFQTKTSAL